MVDGATQGSVSSVESFKLVHEKLPIEQAHEDAADGFTLYRRVPVKGQRIKSAKEADSVPGHWTPCYHFTLSTMSPGDIDMANYYNESCERALWVCHFLTDPGRLAYACS